MIEIPEKFPLLPQNIMMWFDEYSKNKALFNDYRRCMSFVNFEDMIYEWLGWEGLYDDESLNNPDRFSSYPEKTVKKLYCNRKWIPVAVDNSGNCIGIDLDPDENGKSGQVINFGKDEKKKYVFADSIEEFYQMMIDQKDVLSNSSHLTDALISNGLYKE